MAKITAENQKQRQILANWATEDSHVRKEFYNGSKGISSN